MQACRHTVVTTPTANATPPAGEHQRLVLLVVEAAEAEADAQNLALGPTVVIGLQASRQGEWGRQKQASKQAG